MGIESQVLRRVPAGLVLPGLPVWSSARERLRVPPAVTVGLLAVGLVAFFCYGLSVVPLASLNEGLYAGCAREMVESGDWLTPRINTVVYWEKPPLLYWLTALSLSAFGPAEWAVRLPSSLAAAATCLLTFLFARRVYGPQTAWTAVAVVTSAFYYGVQQQMLMFDSLLTLFFAGALGSFYLALGGERRWYLVSAAALALAVMTKGFVALPLFLGVVVPYCLLARRRPHFGYAAWAAPLLFLALTAPWHVYETLYYPGFAWFYYVNEHFLRFLGRKIPADFHRGAPYDHALKAVLLMLPWGLFLIPAALSSVRRHRSDLFPLLWFSAPLLFFSASTAKANYYMVISGPAMAILLALYLQRRRYTAWLPAGLGLVGLLAVAALYHLSRREYADAFRVTRQELTVQVLTLFAVALLLGASLLCMRRGLAAVWALSGMLIVLKLGVVPLAAPVLPYLSEKAVAQELAARLRVMPTTPAIILDGRLENHSALIYYLPRAARPLLIADGRWGDLWYGSHFENRSRLFISREQAWQLVRRGQALYCLDRTRVPPGARVLCAGGDMAVVDALDAGQ